jgi:hypothetical protein
LIRFFSASLEILLGLTPSRLAACLIDIHCGSLICLFTFVAFYCSAMSRYVHEQLTTYNLFGQRLTGLTHSDIFGTIGTYDTLLYILER